MTFGDFKKEIEKLDKEKMSKEIFWWLINNISTYVDTHNKSYSLSFLSDEQMMPEVSKMEHLCYQLKSIEVAPEKAGSLMKFLEEDPEMLEEAKKQDLINDWMDEVRELMASDEGSMKEYFDSLSYYYELVGFYKKTPISKKLKGYVRIDYLSFENLRVPLTKTPLIEIKNEEGEVVDYKRDESKTEFIAEMPPSFCIDIEIEIWEDTGELSIF